MNRFSKTCLSLAARRCRKPLAGRCRRHQIAVVAFLSVVLFTDFPLTGQSTQHEKVIEAYRLEKEGRPAAAITQLESLLDSKALDPADLGKAWNILGLAFEDRGDFSKARHAYEQSIQAYEGLANDTIDYAMTLDDFGALYAATGQLDVAVRLMKRALHLYQAAKDHAGVARASSALSGALFGQKKVREGRKNLYRALKESRLTNELNDDDLATLASLQGWLAQCDGDLPASISKYQQSLDLLRKHHGEEQASTGWGYVLLGQARAETGDLSRSLMEMVKGLAILDRTLSDQDPRFLSAEIAYSRVLDRAGRRSEGSSLRANAERQFRTFRNSQCLDCTVSAKAFR